MSRTYGMVTSARGINDAGQIVGYFQDRQAATTASLKMTVPKPFSARRHQRPDMILRGSDTSSGLFRPRPFAGQYEIYDIGNSANPWPATSLGQIGNRLAVLPA